MDIEVSKIVQGVEPSATLAMSAKAKELKAQGETVYNLSVGEPDFDTPKHICDAAVDAMRAGHTRYTAASGLPELKAAVCADYKARFGLDYAPSQTTRSSRRSIRATKRFCPPPAGSAIPSSLSCAARFRRLSRRKSRIRSN